MVEDSLKRLYSHNYIGENLDHIIEAFVSFYGEDEREFITNRFKNTTILTYYNISDFKENIENVKKSLMKEVFGIKMDEAIFINVDDFYNDCTQYTDNELFVMEKSELAQIFDGDTDKQIIKEKIKNHEYPKILEFIRRYQELKIILAPFEEKCKQESEMEDQVNKKYYDILFNEFKYLLSEDDIYLYTKMHIVSKNTSLYFGLSIDSDNFCFSEESESILEDTEESEWRQKSIIKDRIRLFIANGIDLSLKPEFKLNPPTYEDYLKDARVQELIKKLTKAGKRISKRKKELNKKRINEILNSHERYKECKKEIDELNLLNKEVIISPVIYLYPYSCFSENYQVLNNSIVSHPIVVIVADNSDLDRTIIHELNHNYENYDIMVNNEGCQTVSGWDFTDEKFSHSPSDDIEANYEQMRMYELLSEYINEKIAIDITTIMHNNNHFIYCHNINKQASAYMTLDFLLVDFYETFKSIIIKSRSHGNIEYIYEKLGKENFEALNDLVNEFSNKYGIDYEALGKIQEYKDKKDVEVTYDIQKFVDKKDKIISQMKEHLQSKNVTL